MPIFVSMNKIILKRKVGSRVLNGHPWIFANEIGEIKGAMGPGDIVEVYTSEGKFLGKGYANPQSQIALTINQLTRRSVALRRAIRRPLPSISPPIG